MLPANILSPSPIYQSLFRVPMTFNTSRGPPSVAITMPGSFDGSMKDKDGTMPSSTVTTAAAAAAAASFAAAAAAGLHPLYLQRAIENGTLPPPHFLHHPALATAMPAGAEALLRASLHPQHPPPPPPQLTSDGLRASPASSPTTPTSPPLKFGISAILASDTDCCKNGNVLLVICYCFRYV